jgi:hypothetical protein
MRLRDLQEHVRAKHQATATALPLHSHNSVPITFEKPFPIVIAPEDTPPLTSETEAESQAVLWLHAKLTTPQDIAPLIAEWCGQRDGDTGRWMKDLMAARWALSVQAYEGDDGRMWWRLPTPTIH